MTKAEIEIENVGARGDGIGHYEGLPVYVPFSAPGDKLRVNLLPEGKNAFRGEIIKILAPGKDRIDPPCRHFGICGGCSLQHVSEKFYRGWLTDRIKAALGHQGIGDIAFEEPHISSPGSRRRISLKVQREGKTVRVGLNRLKSHEVVDMKECPVTRKPLVDLVPEIRNLFSNELKHINFSRIDATETDAGVDLVFHLAKAPSREDVLVLTKFAKEKKLARLAVESEGEMENIAAPRPPHIVIGQTQVFVPPESFLQATKDGEKVLIAWVLDNLGKRVKKVLDLFSGLGTFSLALAENYQVRAADADQKLLEALVTGWKAVQGLKPVTVNHRDLYRQPFAGPELQEFDAILFDPPRAGAKKQCEMIAASKVKTVLGISCNPNTFARDARILIDGGYALKAIKPVGQFLWSHHVELAARFEK